LKLPGTASISNKARSAPINWFESKTARLALLLGGLVLAQAVLYGPCLIGRRVLLPLANLAEPGLYLPRTPEIAPLATGDLHSSDLVLLFEPARRFGAAEIRAGRFPTWSPWQYAGAPFAAPKFSPFLLLGFLIESPIILPWIQMLAAIVAGVGAYVFFRRVLQVSFWPAAICAWCYPLTGFFILWQGFQTGNSIYWLPWLFLAVNETARCRTRLAQLALAAVTALTVVSGHLDVACQALLSSGLFALWCLYDAYGRECLKRQATKAVASLAAGWLLGFLLAAPYLMPFLDYARTGARFAHRLSGQEERPPMGLKSLPETILPDLNGADARSRVGTLRINGVLQTESAPAAYAGALAGLLAAPLAWSSRRHRSINAFWVVAWLLALSWCLNLPGVVSFLRLPGLNLLSHNRLAFLACFAVLALAAVGLEQCLRGPVAWRGWLWIPPGLLALLCIWCIWRMFSLPEPLATHLEKALGQGQLIDWIRTVQDVHRVQDWFIRSYSVSALWCGLGLLGWAVTRLGGESPRRPFTFISALLLCEALWFAHGRSVQSDPELYYPRIPVLERLAQMTHDRVLGYRCLPAALESICGLRDVRGYDGVDPACMVELLGVAAAADSPVYPNELLGYYVPKFALTPQGQVSLPPVLDMLGVRYVVFRGAPPADVRPLLQGVDYFVLENPAGLPRVFIPQRVEALSESSARLKRLGSAQFDPRQVAYVESEINLAGPCHGTAELLDESPTYIRVSVRMETPGLVVLSDLWNKDWRAYINGRSTPLLRTNHAVRGVVVPQGTWLLEYRYEPHSLIWGRWLCGLAMLIMLAAISRSVQSCSKEKGRPQRAP
jgi:hypothetical protein